MARLKFISYLVLACLMVAACGKKGDPRPPVRETMAWHAPQTV